LCIFFLNIFTLKTQSEAASSWPPPRLNWPAAQQVEGQHDLGVGTTFSASHTLAKSVARLRDWSGILAYKFSVKENIWISLV